MITYDDPEKDYEFKKVNKSSLKTKVWMITFFVLIAFLIVYLLKNGFNPSDFSAKESFEFQCPESYDLKMYQDYESMKRDVKDILDDHFEEISAWPGFDRFSIIEEDGFKDGSVPVVQLFFDKEEKDSNIKIPSEICGFDTEIIIE